MNELKEALGALEVLDGQEHVALRLFGLRWPDHQSILSYVTLEEAIQAKQLDVTEIGESGQVPRLQVVNRGDTMVFMMAGEQLVGAKQNRMLNVSIMVRPHSEQPIPVSCVEAGRWRYRSRTFTSSEASVHAGLRRMSSQQIAAAYRQSGVPTTSQGAVWQEVARKLGSLGSRSPSSELQQVYRDQQSKLNAAVQALQPPPGCSGAVFAIGNRIGGLDLFDRPETLAKLWPKILRGYAIDALESAGSTPSVSRRAVVDWLSSLASAKTEEFKSPGLGDDVRLESGDAHGSALLVDRHPVHVEVFVNAGA